MKKLLISLCLAMFALAALYGVALAEDAKKVVVKGEGVIFQNDQALAKEKAIEQALRMAVEQVVGVYIESATLVENYVTVEDKILSQSKGFVQSWKELSKKVEGGVVIVEIEATVAVAKLKGSLDQIKWAIAKKNYPRIMFLIAEQSVGQAGFSSWWTGGGGGGGGVSVISMSTVENTLINELGSVGFTFVDPSVLAGKIKVKNAYKVSSTQGISNENAREIANLTDAQVVVVGSAVAVDAGPVMEGSRLHSGQADISVRAINTDNGEILLSSSVHGADAHISAPSAGQKALQKASKVLAKEMLTKMVDKWMQSSGTITIEVAGVKNYQQFEALKQALQHQVGGVKSVMERKMRADKAQLDIFSTTSTSILARELTQKKFKGFKVKIDAVSPNKLEITLK